VYKPCLVYSKIQKTEQDCSVFAIQLSKLKSLN